MPVPTRYAWCFSHGRLHTFSTDRNPWCTATWTWLHGDTETTATANKTAKYGDAQFLHQLPQEQQINVMHNGKEAQ